MLIFFVLFVAAAAAVPSPDRKVKNEESRDALEVENGNFTKLLEKFAPQHRDGIADLLRCAALNSTEILEKFASLVLESEPPIFEFIIPGYLEPWQAKCFTESNDKFIVALFNLLNALEGHYGPQVDNRAKIFPLFVAYTDLCHKDHKFALPCKNDLQFIRENVRDQHTVRKDVERHYRAVELTGALSYVVANLIPGELCKFDLEGRLNPSVFTRKFDPKEPAIQTCKAGDFDNTIFLASGAFL
ncbi:unnamed protein product [Bursaphelenchus xylophilus]|uniref:(pine wood nematode) hypothetical protein n=1 Tax=Bursaphelenchus xylophilus TaxID=6326 RepID=A0A1I7S6V1_BURXY|nr:unnamed protein product [Bursaphelenchus xylophilus]CAG9079736.1 unnamed protein product [Bursaphelenchus xylophilus]